MNEKYLALTERAFIWRYPDQGFVWHEHDYHNIKGPFLVVKPETTGFVNYAPTEDNHALFLELAGIKKNKLGILEFANKYGGLCKTGEAVEPCLTDSFSYWTREITALKRAVMVWKWLMEKNLEMLDMLILWKGSGANEYVQYVLGEESQLKAYNEQGDRLVNKVPNIIIGRLASKEYNQEAFSLFRRGDATLPAQFLLQTLINQKTKEFPSIPYLVFNKNNQLKQHLMPQNLLAAIWLQLYLAVTERKYKRCEICKQWEDVTDNRVNWTKHPRCANRERVAKSKKKRVKS